MSGCCADTLVEGSIELAAARMIGAGMVVIGVNPHVTIVAICPSAALSGVTDLFRRGKSGLDFR